MSRIALIRLRGVRRPGWVVLAVLAVGLVALAMRVYDLGAQALHHDESLHATFSYYFADGRGYRHDPLMHGPFQFHVMAAFFKLFGDGDAMARLPHALAGSALVLTPLLLRRWLGGAGTIAAALLLAFSPTLLYYSRFARNDIFIALFTALLVAAVWCYLHDGRYRWLLLAAATLVLSYSTKETAYLTAAILLVYLEFAVTAALLVQRDCTGIRRILEGAALLAGAWLLVALWRPAGELRRRWSFEERPRAADMLVVVGALTVPFLAAAVQLLFEGSVELAVGGEHTITLWILVLLAASLAVGLTWDWRRWLPIAALAAVIVLPLYTTWFTNLDGFRSAFWGQLDYWIDQQDVQRGGQPGFYYLMMVPLYEFLALLPGLVGGAWLLVRGDRLTRLLAWWFLGTLVMLSFAGEKMPWLTVHLALPLALLAGRALGSALPALRGWLRSERAHAIRWSTAGAGIAAAVLVVALSVRGGLEVTYAHPDTPVEPLIYTQTSPDVPRLAREIRDFVAEAPDQPAIVVDSTSSLTWPWAWYLRDTPNVSFKTADEILDGGVPEGSVLITASSTLPSDSPLREQFARTVSYRHRWWFPESGYKRASFKSLWEGLRDGSLLADWASFLENRVDEDQLGALEGEVHFPRASGVAGAAERR